MTPKPKGVNRNIRQNGPTKGVPLVRTTTRIAKLFRTMTRRKAKAVRIDTAGLAEYLGIHFRTMERAIKKIVDNPGWSYKAYGFVLFMRQTPHRTAPCGCPQWYVLNRYYASPEDIGGAPGKVRAGLRQKTPGEWIRYMKQIFILAWASKVRSENPAMTQHKGSPTGKQEAAAKPRPPPKTNRAALRRFDEIAGKIQLEYESIADAPRAQLFGWARHRFHEQHSFARIVDCLKHAVKVLPQGSHYPSNPAAWISAVATRHLNNDGLCPKLRKSLALSLKPKLHAAGAATLKEDFRAQAERIEVDHEGRKWKHLGGTHWIPI